MKKFPQIQIPPELLIGGYYDDDVNIIVGENGSGKSMLLNSVSEFFTDRNQNVIAIANTIYDKFKISSKKLNILRASNGKNAASRILMKAFTTLANENLRQLFTIATTLEYIGFEPIIGIRIAGVDVDFREKVIQSDLDGHKMESLLIYLNRSADEAVSDNRVAKIYLGQKVFPDILNEFLLLIFSFYSELKRKKLITGIELFLYKDGKELSVKDASSGELTMITSLVFIASTIKEKSIILVDEPENSLHPKWQIEYVKKITELFYFYQPKIIIATHSPLITNGAELSNKSVKIFKGKEGYFQLQRNNKVNIEEVYQKYFDLTTPENRFLSEFVIDNMNKLAGKEISTEEFDGVMTNIKENSYDQKQKDIINQLIKAGKEIVKEIEK